MATMTEQQNSEQYNGWTNRETWAVALHINNDQGWQESVLEALRAYFEGYDKSDGQWWLVATEQAGWIIRENMEEILDGGALGIGYDMHTDPASALAYIKNILPIVSDIGSLWRVNWTELGRSFLEDLEDN